MTHAPSPQLSRMWTQKEKGRKCLKHLANRFDHLLSSSPSWNIVFIFSSPREDSRICSFTRELIDLLIIKQMFSHGKVPSPQLPAQSWSLLLPLLELMYLWFWLSVELFFACCLETWSARPFPPFQHVCCVQNVLSQLTAIRDQTCRESRVTFWIPGLNIFVFARIHLEGPAIY